MHKAVICRYSEYFRVATQAPGNGFQEGRTDTFDLADDNPTAFELFIGWLYSNEKDSLNYSPTQQPDTESWKVHAVEAYIVGDRFLATDFSRYALSKVIQNANLLDIYDIEAIYEDVLPTSPLRLFAAPWIRWRVSSQPHLWETAHSLQLQRDRRPHEPNLANQVVYDPRSLELEHWYSDCGRTGTVCGHNTNAVGPATTLDVSPKAYLRRTWKKRDRHARPTQAKTLIPAFLVAYSSILIKIGVMALGVAIFIVVIVVSIRYCHCGNCQCGGCDCQSCHHPSRRCCDCYPCHVWCTHHAFLFCCSTKSCQCCGGFPFCCFVWCCCQDGYHDGVCCNSC